MTFLAFSLSAVLSNDESQPVAQEHVSLQYFYAVQNNVTFT